MSSIAAIALLIAVAGAVIWRVVAGDQFDATFTVEITGPGAEGVKIKGAVPGQDATALADFVATLELTKGAKFWGVRERGAMQLRFSGVPEGPAQRLRNMIYSRF